MTSWSQLLVGRPLALTAAVVLAAACSEGTTAPPIDDPDDPDPVDTLPDEPIRIVGADAIIRVGDVVHFEAELGEGVEGEVTWDLIPHDAGILDQDGRFVGYVSGIGDARVVATIGAVADTFGFSLRSRGAGGSVSFVGRSEVPLRGTTDLWVHGDAAYTGTRSRFFQGQTRLGNALHTWDVSDPANPVMTSTLVLNAGIVNDVKVSPDGTLGVATHEGADDGITLLDLSDPLQPSIIRHYSEQLENGVHNVWLENDYLYVAGAPAGLGLRFHILDISNPQAPVRTATWHAGSSLLHDVYVRDGLAFLSYWDVGLVILDVGNGVAGGSPSDPVEVSRLPLGGNTHNAWYWPETGYVFVGEEDFEKPGILHVVDASDLFDPVEVATYSHSSVTPHNVWLDEESATLYVAWYSAGLHALDVGGELWGDLDAGGRVRFRSLYNNNQGCSSFGPNCTYSWAPQFHEGLVYVSDVGSGLWVLDPEF